MSKADLFERVAASVPQSATAAKVVARGTHYDPKVKFGTVEHHETPPPWRLPHERELHSCRGVVGMKVGRLTVLGIALIQNFKMKSRWVVRCACGDYEFRKMAALRQMKERGEDACCRKCEQEIINRKRYARLGSRPVEDFIAQNGALPKASA